MQDALKICKDAMQKYSVPIASIPVDNAARHVAAEVTEILMKDHGIVVVVSRDPAHCVDLLSKDLMQTMAMKRIL